MKIEELKRGTQIWVREFEEALLDLREVLCKENIANYCIENGISWSDSAMVASPVEVVGLAKELIEFCFTLQEVTE